MADYEWAQVTLGQNDKIAEVAGAAGKASALLSANLAFVKVAFELGKVLLLASVNPQLILLEAIANEIDNFIDDLRSTGFFVLEVTPTGMEVTPSDAEGNPVLLALSPLTLSSQYAVAATAGLLTQFTDALAKNGITSLNGVFEKSVYKVPIGKSLGDELLKKNKDDDSMSLRDGVFGLKKMTPSQVIATMVAAMDDPLDDRRPQFSDSADVAAVIVIIGFADLTKNAASLKEVLDLFVNFFGGPTGLFTKGLSGLGESLGEVLDNLANTKAFDTKVEVVNVCGVRGSLEDRKILRQLIPESQWNEFAEDESKYYYNYFYDPNTKTLPGFQIGDLVIGSPKEAETPVEDFFSSDRALGYISEVSQTDDMAISNNIEIANGTPYRSFQYTISCLSPSDKAAFDNFGAGALIQKVAYFKTDSKHVDQNSMEVIEDGSKNGYKLIQNLTDTEAASVASVIRESGNILLTITGTESVIEEHGAGGGRPGGGFKTKNGVQGLIGKVKKVQGTPPNFKAVKLDDLIEPLGEFLDKIQGFTQQMRDFAADATKEIEKQLKYLADKIKELEELNKAIQSILKIFTDGLPDSGVYSLSIPSTSGGNNAIKDALANATNGPPNSLDFSVGFMMVGGAAAIDPLLKLLGKD